MLVVDDPERVGVQVTAKLSDNDVRKPPDHFQVARAVVVLERGRLVLVSFVSSRAHVADQVHLKVSGLRWGNDRVHIYTCAENTRPRYRDFRGRDRNTIVLYGGSDSIPDRVNLETPSRKRIMLSMFLLLYRGQKSRCFAMSSMRLRPRRCYFTATSGCGDVWLKTRSFRKAMRKVRRYSASAERVYSNNSNTIFIKSQLCKRRDNKSSTTNLLTSSIRKLRLRS